MTEPNIRIKKITVTNIKNVANGTVCLNNVGKETAGASIVGIYGQNGSGKTALVWAVGLIKNAISGQSLPKDTYYYIRQQSVEAAVKVDFLITIDEREYDVIYTLSLMKKNNNKVQIVSEYVDFSAKATESLARINKTRILGIEYPLDKNEIDKCSYIPETRIAELSNKDKQIRQKLLVSQALALENEKSFIFNDKTMSLLEPSFSDSLYFKILKHLRFYSRMNLFVLNKNSESSYNMYLLPLSMRLSNEDSIKKADAVFVGLGQNKSNLSAFNTIKSVVAQIDILIEKIIPGLRIEIVQTSSQLNKNAEEEVVFELVSDRNGVITPLRYESEGIKKILCVLSSLIAMYNNSSVFVAIDELDAGVFEYLLGEILETISKTGKGQLLFTSHNMRPLEVLQSTNIYVTTTSPENKYIRFKGIKANNNLRNTLLRTIDLGGQEEQIYENTSSYQMGIAFMKAGKELESGTT